MANTLYLTFDLEEWPWPYNVTTHLLFCVIYLYTKYQMSISIGSNVMAKTLYLTFDLELWPWPPNVTTQNERLRDKHVYTKYQISTSIESKVMANVNVDELTYIFYLWPWRWPWSWYIAPVTSTLKGALMFRKHPTLVLPFSNMQGSLWSIVEHGFLKWVRS